MQKAVNCTGSKNSHLLVNSNTSATTTTTTTTSAEEKDCAIESLANSTTLKLETNANVLRQRCLKDSSNASHVNFEYKHNYGISIETDKHPGSNVEQMSATPTPEASPNKTTATATATAATAIALSAFAQESTAFTAVTAPSLIVSSDCGDCAANQGVTAPANKTLTPNTANNSSCKTKDTKDGIIDMDDACGHFCNSALSETMLKTVERSRAAKLQTLKLPAKSAAFANFLDEPYYAHMPNSYFASSSAATPSPTYSSSSSASSSTSFTSISSAASTVAATTHTTVINSNSSATAVAAANVKSNLTTAITTAGSSTLNSATMEAELLQWQDMPQYLQFNPYVLRGYRPLQTFKGCLLSLFYWHNETINILTHAIPIVYILAIVPGLMPWEKGFRFLSFCHVFGSVAPWCGSFVYHLFMNIEKGENVYYRLLKLDMVGIWVSQSFGALPLVTATAYCFSPIWKCLVIISYCLLSLWGLYKALTASSPWQRRLCFALPFTMRSVLTFLRTLGLVGGSQLALSHVYLQDGVSILGGAIGAMRIPEKWFPGLVDFYLNSHNIMHVLVVVAVYSMHKATIKDFEWMLATECNGLSMSSVDSHSVNIESDIATHAEL